MSIRFFRKRSASRDWQSGNSGRGKIAVILLLEAALACALKEPRPDVLRSTLDNGLRVVIVPNRIAPVASIGGAGTFDSIFFLGILSALLASLIAPKYHPRHKGSGMEKPWG